MNTICMYKQNIIYVLGKMCQGTITMIILNKSNFMTEGKAFIKIVLGTEY